LIDYTPKAEKIVDRVFAARGLKRLDSWHLLEIAVDPACEGKGASSSSPLLYPLRLWWLKRLPCLADDG
jgi:hypothetical protein